VAQLTVTRSCPTEGKFKKSAKYESVENKDIFVINDSYDKIK